MTPELLIISPSEPGRATKLASRMVDLGVFFAFENPYRLPQSLPKDLSGFKHIVIPRDKGFAEQPRLEAYAREGGVVTIMDDEDWENESFIERIPVRGGLTLNHPGMMARMEAVPDEQVFYATLHWSTIYTDTRWNDVLRYHIECMVEAFDLTGRRDILDQMGHLVSKAIAARPSLPATCDHVACAYAILGYMERSMRPELLPMCQRVVDDFVRLAPRYRRVLGNFLRADEGGILRSEIAFQACPAFARLARFTGEQRYADLAVEQILLLDRELRDEKTGLWHLGRGQGGLTPSLWARGCVFSLRGVLDTLAELDRKHPGLPKLAAILTRMAASLVHFQDENGEWRQVLDEPDTRPEGSAGAWGVAVLAKGIRLGYLSADFLPAVKKGWRAAKRRIWDGRCTRICAGTTASMDPDYYRYRPFTSASFGHFHLLAAIEILRLGGSN